MKESGLGITFKLWPIHSVRLYFVSTMGYADNEWLEECNNNCEKDDSISYITIGTTNLSNGWFY